MDKRFPQIFGKRREDEELSRAEETNTTERLHMISKHSPHAEAVVSEETDKARS